MTLDSAELEVDRFRPNGRSALSILATDAAGEINLQFCWLMVNTTCRGPGLNSAWAAFTGSAGDPVWIIVNLIANNTGGGHRDVAQSSRVIRARAETDKVFDVLAESSKRLDCIVYLADALVQDNGGAAQRVRRPAHARTGGRDRE